MEGLRGRGGIKTDVRLSEEDWQEKIITKKTKWCDVDRDALGRKQRDVGGFLRCDVDHRGFI